MAIVAPPRNDMPMQVRYDIAKAGKIDFVRMDQAAKHAFDSQYHSHQVLNLARRQIAHFGTMLVPDNPTKPWKRLLLCTFNLHHTASAVLPYQFAAKRVAQGAGIVHRLRNLSWRNCKSITVGGR